MSSVRGDTNTRSHVELLLIRCFQLTEVKICQLLQVRSDASTSVNHLII